MKRLALSSLAIILAQPALALSCLPPDAVALYEWARDSEDRYMIVRGRLSADGEVSIPVEGKDAETPVRVEGAVLTSEGFTAAFDRNATLRLTCAGPWCANAPEPGDVIIAVKIEGRDLVVEQGPCFSNLVPADDDAADRVETCHGGGACEKVGPL